MSAAGDSDWLLVEGEMAARVRAFPWHATPLGDRANWPQSLRTLVKLMLASRQPMFMAWGRERTWLYNDAFIPILGNKHPHALGRHAIDAVWPEARQVLAPLFDRVFAGASVERRDSGLMLDRLGRLEEAHFAFGYTPARDESGHIAGLFGACIEITEQIAAERRQLAMLESEMRFREIADAAPVLIWISDASKACVWFNRSWLEFTGRKLEQEVGSGWMASVHPDDLAQCIRAYHDAFDARARYRGDYRLRRHDGEWRIVEDAGAPRFSSGGEFLGYVGSCVDVTDQRAAEQALRRNEEQLRLATDAAEIGLWDVDLVTDTLFWPPRVKAMFGISADVPVSMADFYAGLHPEDRDATTRAFAGALDSERRALYDVEYRTVGKEDGIVRWVAAKGRGIFDADGRCVRVIGTAIDITARKHAEERLREREEHLRAVVDTSPECVKLVARDGTLLQMNASGLAMVGAEREESVVGRNVYDLIAPEHRDAFSAFNERVCGGERGMLEFDVIGLTGERRHMETHAAPLRMPDGESVQLALTRDVTARRGAEEALRESDRRKDEFIATLSHELRNPLAPLMNGLQILRLVGSHDAKAQHIRDMMERQVTHLVRLVDDLLEMSRINHGTLELRRERVELASIVSNAIETSEPIIREAQHVLDVALPSEPVWLDGDPVRLAQILANLLNNAARYMAPGGRIVITAEISEDAVAVAVRDQGAGFAPDSARDLFEMFARGEQSTGLGIGLALARRLAQMHRGTIDGASEGPGKGAVFTLRLPRATAPEQILLHPLHAAESATSHRILVVDDNRDAAESMRMMLELLGATVYVAEDGVEALATFDARQPDVVLLDIGMPGMSGYDVAREIRARTAGDGTVIVAVTGWGQERDRRRSRDAGFDHHLVKPADFDALQKLLSGIDHRRDMASMPGNASLAFEPAGDSRAPPALPADDA